jgi:hypothetical protein
VFSLFVRSSFWVLALWLCGCGPLTDPGVDAARDGDDPACTSSDVATRTDGRVVGGPYATRVVSFEPGEAAGFGAEGMPDIVLGPPQGAGDRAGGRDVVSLGVRGTIVLGFDVDIVDEPGPDFVVFENAFVVDGAAGRVWSEPAEVSVSDDGVRWTPFRCVADSTPPYMGCAGLEVVYSSTASGYCALDPRVSGGDLFDLATVGLRRARYVRIRDLGVLGVTANASGFDLDAIAVLHRTQR